jgi:hypothetical protein
METKARLTTITDDNIRNASPKVRKANHADQQDRFIGNIFDNNIIQDSDEEITYVVAASTSNYPFYLIFSKIGDRISVDGWIMNLSGLMASQTVICTIPATVGGNPNPIIPDDSNDPATGVPFAWRGEAIRVSDEDRIRLLIFKEGADYKLRVSGFFAASPGGPSENYKHRIYNMSYNAKY